MITVKLISKQNIDGTDVSSQTNLQNYINDNSLDETKIIAIIPYGSDSYTIIHK